jgi:hypothetical protein
MSGEIAASTGTTSGPPPQPTPTWHTPSPTPVWGVRPDQADPDSIPPALPPAPKTAAAATPAPDGFMFLPVDPKHWVLYGKVLDLRTLRPLPGVELRLFIKDELSGWRAVTDRAGRYLLVLPRVNGTAPENAFTIRAYDPRYSARALHEPDIPYASLSKADRESLIEAAVQDDLHSTRVFDTREERERVDVFLAPLDDAP